MAIVEKSHKIMTVCYKQSQTWCLKDFLRQCLTFLGYFCCVCLKCHDWFVRICIHDRLGHLKTVKNGIKNWKCLIHNFVTLISCQKLNNAPTHYLKHNISGSTTNLAMCIKMSQGKNHTMPLMCWFVYVWHKSVSSVGCKYLTNDLEKTLGRTYFILRLLKTL